MHYPERSDLKGPTVRSLVLTVGETAGTLQWHLEDSGLGVDGEWREGPISRFAPGLVSGRFSCLLQVSEGLATWKLQRHFLVGTELLVQAPSRW